jgi:hypothetical protein
MEHRRGLELGAIFALSLLASVTALELDYEVFSAVFGAAARAKRPLAVETEVIARRGRAE